MAFLDAAEQEALLLIIDHAVMAVNQGYLAYQKACFNQSHAEALQSAERNMAQLLSRPFADLLSQAALHVIRDYKEKASDLLEGLGPMRGIARKDVRDIREKIEPGRYEVRRQIRNTQGVVVHEMAIPCINPAFGFSKLDEWEASLEPIEMRVRA